MSAIPLRKVYYRSLSASRSVRGPSGQFYNFKGNERSKPVLNQVDIQAFDARDDLLRENEDGTVTPPRDPRDKPKSYVSMGKTKLPFTITPPTPAEIAAANEIKAKDQARRQMMAEAESARAMAEKGMGTDESKAARERGRLASKGTFVDAPPETKPKWAPMPEAMKKSSGKTFACEHCQKTFDSVQGQSIHTRLHCTSNPASARSQKLAAQAEMVR
jgi:hypothetical protein